MNYMIGISTKHQGDNRILSSDDRLSMCEVRQPPGYDGDDKESSRKARKMYRVGAIHF